MADLEKITVTIKNFDVKALSDLDTLYTRVRLEDSQGNTFYFCRSSRSKISQESWGDDYRCIPNLVL